MCVTRQFWPLLLWSLLLSSLPHGSWAQVRRPADPERFSVESRRPGLRLSVLHAAPANRSQQPPVLFVHGASFPAALAAGFRMRNYSWLDDLAAVGYDAYALDFLGYGHSDRYPEMSQDVHRDPAYAKGSEVAQDLDRAVDAILKRTGARRVHLIGYSWGATVSAYYATQHPEKIARLVLFAPFPPNPSPGGEPPAAAYTDLTPDERVAQFASGVPAGEEPVLEPEIRTTWKAAWLASDPTATSRTPASVRFPAGWETDFYQCQQGHCYYDPARLTVPTLLIRGEWDRLPTAAAADALFQAMHRAPVKRYVVIAKGTHVLHLEKSRFQLYQEVRNFLAENFTPLAP